MLFSAKSENHQFSFFPIFAIEILLKNIMRQVKFVKIIVRLYY